MTGLGAVGASVAASETVGALDVAASLGGLTTCATSILTWITSSEVLAIVFVGGCLSGVAFRFIRRAIKTSKS